MTVPIIQNIMISVLSRGPSMLPTRPSRRCREEDLKPFWLDLHKQVQDFESAQRPMTDERVRVPNV